MTDLILLRKKASTFHRGILLTLLITTGLINYTSQSQLDIFPIQSVQRKPVGKPLMLTCRANVEDPMAVKHLEWKNNNNEVVHGKLSGQGMPAMYTELLPGGQTLGLIINSLTESMAGDYYCSASYNNEALEASVKIETYVAITWKNAPENQYPKIGSDYNVKCEVTANPAPTIDWLRNGEHIRSGDRYVIETSGLLIQNVQESDDGIYTCRAVVIQTGELSERNIRVEVQRVPVVIQFPKLINAVEEKSFSIRCNASGKPVPKYTWIKDNSQLNVASSDRFIVNEQTGELSITRVTSEDYGNYTCTAANAAGYDSTKTLLNVLIRPRIYGFNNITVAQGTEGSIVCSATGRPPPRITFRRWGSQLDFVLGVQPSDNRIILEQDFNETYGAATGTLIIRELLRSDDGLYECVARNEGENAFRVGHITVEYPPSFERMKGLPPVYSWEERTANLSCLAEGFPNATVEWRINDRLIKSLDDPYLRVEGAGPRSDLLVTPKERRYYTAYKCIANNRLGRAEHYMELREARVPDMIPQVNPIAVTATAITFNIILPPAEPGLPITAISGQYKEHIQSDWNFAFNRTWSPGSIYIVEGLKPLTTYTFRFAARNHVGLGQFSAIKVQSTPQRSVPEIPKFLHSGIVYTDNKDEIPTVIASNPDRFSLRWAVPADNGEPINFYQIKYCPGKKFDGSWVQFENSCVTNDVPVTDNTGFEMLHLEGDTYYTMELRAHNAIGFSNPATLMLKTGRGRDIIIHTVTEYQRLSSAAIIAIAIGSVLIALIIIDFVLCLSINFGVLAIITRETKLCPSDRNKEKSLRRNEIQPLNTSSTIDSDNSLVRLNAELVPSEHAKIIGMNSPV